MTFVVIVAICFVQYGIIILFEDVSKVGGTAIAQVQNI